MMEDIDRLIDLLDSDGNATAGTSVRFPSHLRDAAAVAVQLGLAPSMTELAVRGLRDILEAFAQRLVLDQHYRQHPEARPSLYETALAAAELDGNPLAGRPDLLRLAADHLGTTRPDPTPDDVLVLAAGLDLAEMLRSGS